MDELSLTEIVDVVDEVAAMLQDWENRYGIAFSPSFNITGGEPFLRDDLFEILAEIGGRGFAVFLLSNGALIDGKRAGKLAELRVKGVQISIEGPEHIHDEIRGKGSFTASRAGVGNLLEAGLPVTLNVTISRLNAMHMPEMVTLAAELGVQRLGFSRFVPTGRGIRMLDEMLTPHEVKELYKGFAGLSVPGLDIVTGDPVAAQMHIEPPHDAGCATPFGGCAAGVSGLTLLADGTITPCRRLEIPLGNVRNDSLREVWATSEVLALLRDKSKYRGKCGACARWTGCRGCRAIAYAFSQAEGGGDFLAEDPQCFI
ncbi:MAG: Radical SAM domain [Geobacteraceae bacterium]|nr:MAG: Radical SAM domain [Geobacteraceae bacterium]